MSLVTRDEFFALKLPTSDLDVPEFGEGKTLRVRAMSAGDRLKWARMQSKAVADEVGAEPSSYLIALCALGEDGRPMFKPQDADQIAELFGDTVGRISVEILKMSKVIEGDAEDAEGNSEPSPSGGSSSDLPKSSDAPSENLSSDSPQPS